MCNEWQGVPQTDIKFNELRMCNEWQGVPQTDIKFNELRMCNEWQGVPQTDIKAGCFDCKAIPHSIVTLTYHSPIIACSVHAENKVWSTNSYSLTES